MNLDFKKDLNRIIKNYSEGKASAEEIEFIEHYYQHLAKNPSILDQATESERIEMEDENYKAIQSNIKMAERKTKKVPFYRYAAAAVMLLVLGGGLFFAIHQTKIVPSLQQIAKTKSIDVMPGIDRAILTLADGSKVVLDDTNEEKTIQQTGLIVSKTKDGQLIYTAKSNATAAKNIAFNTIQTSRGNQYQIVLPDGTRVWLNAASSLKFPELFDGANRKVELTGEGYFEVAKDKAHPFIVRTITGEATQDVEVLGTHFNINSYLDDHQIKTTLLEGSVRITNQKTTKTLKPGEQSQLDNQHIAIENVDTDDETAWKNGLFRFNHSSLKSILYQLERWYDIKIDYNNIPNKRYNGVLPRNAKLSEVIKMLALTGNIDFKIEENKQLKVYPK